MSNPDTAAHFSAAGPRRLGEEVGDLDVDALLREMHITEPPHHPPSSAGEPPHTPQKPSGGNHGMRTPSSASSRDGSGYVGLYPSPSAAPPHHHAKSHSATWGAHAGLGGDVLPGREVLQPARVPADPPIHGSPRQAPRGPHMSPGSSYSYAGRGPASGGMTPGGSRGGPRVPLSPAGAASYNSGVTSLVTSGAPAPSPGVASRSTPVPGPAEARRLVRWIEMVIRQHGGRVIGANLGSALANSNSALYRSIKTRYGGLTPLLSKFPDHFQLENDPPFNHVALKNSPLAAPGAASPGGSAAVVTGSGRPAHQDISSKSPADIEQDFVRSAIAILQEAPGQTLKAVELANMLRSRMGTEALASVREHHGGLLALLERHPELFAVERIPKNDSVSLIARMAPVDFRVPGAVVGLDPSMAGMGVDDMGDVYGVGSMAVPSRCLHVGNVSSSMTEPELHAQFSAYGRIEAIKLVSQKGRRFAFVNFYTIAEAERAKSALSKVHMWRSNISFAKRETIAVQPRPDSEPIEVRRARWIKSRNFVPSRHLWIGCLFNTTKNKIHEAFSRFGDIEDVNFLKDRRCAFVDFKRMEDCVAAFKSMQNMRIGDQIIELGFGRARPDRGAVDLSPSVLGSMAPASASSAVAVQMAEIAGMFPSGHVATPQTNIPTLVRNKAEFGHPIPSDDGDPWAGTALTASMTGLVGRHGEADPKSPHAAHGGGYPPPTGRRHAGPPTHHSVMPPSHDPRSPTAGGPHWPHSSLGLTSPAASGGGPAPYPGPVSQPPTAGSWHAGTAPGSSAVDGRDAGLLHSAASAAPDGSRWGGNGASFARSPMAKGDGMRSLPMPGNPVPRDGRGPPPAGTYPHSTYGVVPQLGRELGGAPHVPPPPPPMPPPPPIHGLYAGGVALGPPPGLFGGKAGEFAGQLPVGAGGPGGVEGLLGVADGLSGLPRASDADGTALRGVWSGPPATTESLMGSGALGIPVSTSAPTSHQPPGASLLAPSPYSLPSSMAMPDAYSTPASSGLGTDVGPLCDPAVAALLATPSATWWPVPSRDQLIRSHINALLSYGRGEMSVAGLLSGLARSLQLPAPVNPHTLSAFLLAYPDAVIAGSSVVLVSSPPTSAPGTSWPPTSAP